MTIPFVGGPADPPLTAGDRKALPRKRTEVRAADC